MNQKQIEKRSLIVSTIVNFIMGIAGLIVFFVTKMHALFLDGFFSLIAGISTIMAVIFSKASKKKNASYPTGMFFLEPFYGIIKAILMFVLLASSTVETGMSAYQYFKYGIGETIRFSIVIPYTLVMLVMSFGLFIFNKKQNKKIKNASIMLTAESKSNFIDGIISCGISCLILVLLFVDKNGAFAFLHYTGDFFITIFLVVLFIKEPILLFSMSIREISGATVKDKEIKKLVRKI
ncbi:MAG: cation transporter, partial [Clostridia bacterium]|nr:cation transporter [Clostridia bacterium]